MDIQFGGALARGAQNYFWVDLTWMVNSSIGIRQLLTVVFSQLSFAQAVFSRPNAPTVISMSWGWPEDGQCESGIGSCTDPQVSKRRREDCCVAMLLLTCFPRTMSRAPTRSLPRSRRAESRSLPPRETRERPEISKRKRFMVSFSSLLPATPTAAVCPICSPPARRGWWPWARPCSEPTPTTQRCR